MAGLTPLRLGLFSPSLPHLVDIAAEIRRPRGLIDERFACMG
jgi:hypothetical protein